jgi:Na+-transporting NADH:ubiquinone oxidoreductase subunit D
MSEVAQPKSKESLFSKKNKRLISDPLDDNNPITVQVLGICSALAVTGQFDKALVMSICVVMVTALSNLTISSIRNFIPNRIRMIVQLVVIATLVTLVNEFLKAFQYDIYRQISVFVGLIITNCIIMGRLEAFALANRPWPSFLDGIGNGIGYGIILLIVAFFREIFGAGSLTLAVPFTTMSYQVNFINNGLWNFENFGYVNNGIMVMPIAAMFLIGILIWIQRGRNQKLIDIS